MLGYDSAHGYHHYRGKVTTIRFESFGHIEARFRRCGDQCYYRCDMKPRPSANTLRRSVALPSTLISELNAVAPPELRTNLNRLVIVSLQEYVARRRRQEFDSAIAAMAEDPQVQAECAAIARDFATTEMDGFAND